MEQAKSHSSEMILMVKAFGLTITVVHLRDGYLYALISRLSARRYRPDAYLHHCLWITIS